MLAIPFAYWGHPAQPEVYSRVLRARCWSSQIPTRQRCSSTWPAECSRPDRDVDLGNPFSRRALALLTAGRRCGRILDGLRSRWGHGVRAPSTVLHADPGRTRRVCRTFPPRRRRDASGLHDTHVPVSGPLHLRLPREKHPSRDRGVAPTTLLPRPRVLSLQGGGPSFMAWEALSVFRWSAAYRPSGRSRWTPARAGTKP